MKIIIISLFLNVLVINLYAIDKNANHVFVGYDRPIPKHQRKSISNGITHDRPIPKPEKKPWNGND